MAGSQSNVALQKYGLVPFATGLALIGLGCRTMGTSGGDADIFVSGVLVAVGFALAAFDVRRRSSRLILRVASQGEVSVEEPSMPPRVLNWSELSVFEPSLLATLGLLAVFVGSAWGVVQVLWSFAPGADHPGTDPWSVLLALSVSGWLTAVSGSLLVERTQWVELRFPGHRGAVFFSYRALERLGALEGLKASRKSVGVPLDLYLLERVTAPPRDSQVPKD
ncbi:hypothetical protein [Vitiosangium sp. GDMCC 1.1324]|uniref:hypothetical protein n=1 Tax=Vitiosangium sp. (strain GDMCC 1.1324) TaxID=2138576 RepID=UPI0011B53D5C|nr:hypothetical protein [Vitiosangium sp. GDMCC 1.1324]